jgi:uncharacterized protein (TIGR03083 family)
MDLAHDDAKRAFLEELRHLVATIEALDDRQLLAPTRCYGWAVIDLLVHLNLSLQEMLPDFFARTDEPPEVDAATYWLTDLPTNDPAADEVDRTLYVRRAASAYRRPSGLVRHLSGSAEAVARASELLAPGTLVFQDHAMTTGNYLAVWAAELAVHHLDLMVELDIPGPTAAALLIARRTVEELVEAPMPSSWSDDVAVLVGWGRTPLSPSQQLEAGRLANRLPALS